MKTLLLTISTIFIIVSVTKSQNKEKNEILIKEISRLEKEIKLKSDSLIVVRERLKLSSLSVDYDSVLYAIIEISGEISQEPGWGNILKKLSKNDTVTVIDCWSNGYWLVEKDDVRGFINEIYIKKSELLEKYKANWNLIEIEKERAKQESLKLSTKLREEQVKAANKQKESERRTRIINNYGNEIGQKILKKQFWIGMTSEMARESLGTPKDINRSVGAWGVHEQWIYGNTYLYFEDGILKSYQN